MAKRPKVSIVTITYNHEKYITDALDSFVMQKTDFDVEIVIADDCSTDDTPQIIKRYAEAYPNIRPILRNKNIGAINNSIEALKAARGDYIALCEGDDYFTDRKKIQRQADFLDSKPSYALCFHPVKVFFESKEAEDSIYPPESDPRFFTTSNLLKGNFIQTNSVMYRKQKYDNLPTDITFLDWYLHLYHAQFGRIGFINEVMSAYRRHHEGIWWDTYENIEVIWEKHGIAHLNLYEKMTKLYGHDDKYEEIIYEHIHHLFIELVKLYQKNNKGVLEQAISKFPLQGARVLESEYSSGSKKDKEIERLAEELYRRNQEFEIVLRDLRNILNSRSWQMAQKLSKAKGALALQRNRKNK